ncbi:MAG: hypothetical protein HY925_13870 [Elusimicrobia bacterium]|nr:hypothetical protein [Elusimicrobiota bacterium]
MVLVFREARDRSAYETKNGCIVVSRREKLRNLAVVAGSFFSLMFVVFELLMHYRNHAGVLR